MHACVGGVSVSWESRGDFIFCIYLRHRSSYGKILVQVSYVGLTSQHESANLINLIYQLCYEKL